MRLCPTLTCQPSLLTFVTRKASPLRLLEFTILTAARTGETIGATWDEIDFKGKVWTVPAGRIKGGKEHRVPLSDRAIALLKAMPRKIRIRLSWPYQARHFAI